MKSSANVLDVHRNAGERDAEGSIMSVRYTVDGKYVFSASSSGIVSVAPEGQRAVQHFVPAGDNRDSCTCVRTADVPPDAETGGYRTAATTAEGRVTLWDIVPGKANRGLGYVVEEGNEVMTCAFPVGSTTELLTGGSDGTLRLYSLREDGQLELKQKVEQGIDRTGQPTLGPPAKVMASVFADRNTVLVGGWESSVLLYDMRSKRMERTFDGPRLSGDAVDVRDGCVLAASHRPKDQLQVFDLSTGKQLTPSVSLDTLPFACRLFGRASKLGAWVAGTSEHSVHVVNLLTGDTIASVTDFAEAVYAVDVCPTDPAKGTVGCARDATYRIKAQLP